MQIVGRGFEFFFWYLTGVFKEERRPFPERLDAERRSSRNRCPSTRILTSSSTSDAANAETRCPKY